MNTDTITETFLNRLRRITTPSHTHLESLPVSVSIMDPELTSAQYALYLSYMHDVVKDAEENIYPLLSGIVPDIEARKKAHYIEDDLKLLGESKKSYIKVFTQEQNREFSADFALGIMYVVEGSSLGGRVILKNITAALGHDAESGARYFAGYGPVTGSMWKNFLDTMVQHETTCNCADAIIAGADFAFGAIASHFINASNKII